MENSTKWPSHSPDGTVSSSNLKDEEDDAWGNIKARFLLLLLTLLLLLLLLLLRPTRRLVFADKDPSREEKEEEEEEEEEANISLAFVRVCVFIARI
jgi:hypothetical protein